MDSGRFQLAQSTQKQLLKAGQPTHFGDSEFLSQQAPHRLGHPQLCGCLLLFRFSPRDSCVLQVQTRLIDAPGSFGAFGIELESALANLNESALSSFWRDFKALAVVVVDRPISSLVG